MNEIDELFKKRDAQWAAYCKKRDRNNTLFNFAIVGIVMIGATVIIGTI